MFLIYLYFLAIAIDNFSIPALRHSDFFILFCRFAAYIST
jgi:hypothetical protein